MLNILRIPFSICSLFWGLCLFSVLFPGCGLFDPAEDNVGIVVGSTHITTNKLKTDMEFISAGMEVPDQQRDQLRNKLVAQCIEHYLIMEYGKQNGITISERELQKALKDIGKNYTDDAFDNALLRGFVDVEQWKARLKEQLLVKKIIGKATESIAPPIYQDIVKYYEANQNEFKSPKMIEFRQIVTRTGKEAEDLLKRLQNGEQMSELARKHSVAPEAENGGNVGWMAEGHLNESMEKILFSMPQGKISPVVETPYGYHIFEVLSVKPAGLTELSDAIEEIESKLFLQKREVFLKKWLQDLRNHFEVKVNQDRLSKLELSE